MRRSDPRTGPGEPRAHQLGGFAPLLDAKAASRLLGVPHTWLLARAREGRIPHHRLGHYVRFDAADLRAWLQETKRTPHDPDRASRARTA